MAKPAKVNLIIPRGRTFSKELRWGQPRLAYRAIQSVSQAAPCTLETQIAHDMPDGWPFAIANAKGMVDINSPNEKDERTGKIRYTQNHVATRLSNTGIEINDLISSGFKPYTGGGILIYKMPVDLAGSTAAAQVRACIESSEILLSLTTENGGIVLNNVTKTITLQRPAAITADLEWADGVWDLEVTSAGGIVTPVAYGSVTVVPEVTR